MLERAVTLPLWLFALLLIAAGYAMVMSVLFPSVRWFFRRRLNRAVDRINDSLHITIKPFQRTRRQILIDQLIFDQEVIATIEEIARETGKPRDVLQHEVKRYAREIVPAFNAYVYFRVGYWLAKKAARFVYRVRVAAADQRGLSSIDKDSTVVFVMNHRSNMDYILISYLAAEQVTLSYAVGEWARVFPLESLIRAMGAFFVRRGSQNPLYRKVLARYVYMATQSGVCQAVFLEGGLSRDGKLGQPRLGFLDYMLRHYDPQSERNITFIPVGINYDRVLEDSNLLRWDDKSSRKGKWGNIKLALHFLRTNLFTSSRNRWHRFGYASVNFGIPVSMREYATERQLNFRHLGKEQRIEEVEKLAHHLMDAIRVVIPIIPVPVLATVFMQSLENDEGQPLKSLDIMTRADQLMELMMERGAAMKPEQKPRTKTMADALENLKARGVLVEENDHFSVNPDYHGLLEYYANSVGHWWQEDHLSAHGSAAEPQGATIISKVL
jgi:glycerol-3-phosphate O-acyltransferase